MKIFTTLFLLFIGNFVFAQQKVKVPFFGIRYFDLDKGASGSGTPIYYIDIKKNGNVCFGYEQENKADHSLNKEEINVGKYKSGTFKVQFKKLNINYYAKFDAKKIIQTDASGKAIRSDDCCPIGEMAYVNCVCESELIK